MKAQGTLAHETVVVTVMSNLGFLHAMRDAGLTVIQAKVGDRYVLEQMRTGRYNLGGEQSGHVILSDHVATVTASWQRFRWPPGWLPAARAWPAWPV